MSAAKLSRWDRFLIGIAPRWGMRRVQARLTASALVRHFDAAGGGRRTAGWRRSNSDANTAHGPNLATLRSLARDLRRNNGWARRGIHVIANNTVGWGISPKATGVAQGTAAQALKVWKAWAESSACDVEGRLPFAGLQRLVMETVVESGEALVLRHYPTSAQMGELPIPLQLRVVEPDLIDTSKDGWVKEDGGGYTLQGIEFDAAGRRTAYWLFPRHPGGAVTVGRGFESKRVPAADVLHIYRVDRPGQVRGVSWLAAAIAQLNDFDDYADAILMQQKVAACFSAFVQDLDGMASPVGEQGTDPMIEKLEPGHIAHLPAGKTVTFAQPPGLTDHATFTQTNLRRVAATLGVTYQELTEDYSQVNFSSGRMARLAHWSSVHDWRWNMLIPQLCDGVWRWAMGEAYELGLVRKVPAADWAPPPMPMLEPDKEGLAYQRLVRSGAMTLYGMLRERGEDPAVHLAEIAESNKLLDKLGIVLDSDPRKTTASGGPLATGAPAAGDDDANLGDGDELEQPANGRLLS